MIFLQNSIFKLISYRFLRTFKREAEKDTEACGTTKTSLSFTFRYPQTQVSGHKVYFYLQPRNGRKDALPETIAKKKRWKSF
jgi:hexokinase